VAIDGIRALLAVIEHGSVQGAATALMVGRATIRRRIDELEAQAGTVVLERGPSGVRLTEAGELLASRGRLIIEDVRNLLGVVRELGDEPAGLVRMVLPTGLPPRPSAILAKAILSTGRRLALDIRFREDPMSGLLDDTDIAITFGDATRAGPWTTMPMLAPVERLVATADYLREHPVTSVGDLDSCDLLVWRSPDRDPNRLPLLAGGDVSITPKLVSSDIHLIRHITALSCGIAYVPDGAMPDADNAIPELSIVLPDVVGRARTLSIVVPTTLLAVPRIRRVIDMMELFARAFPMI